MESASHYTPKEEAEIVETWSNTFALANPIEAEQLMAEMLDQDKPKEE